MSSTDGGMKHTLVYGLVMLGIVSLILQGMATRRNTSIPGLVFPSATPTNTPTATVTYTPTITNTPTITRTPTVTRTPTPDPVMVSCAAALTVFLELHRETDKQIKDAFDMSPTTTYDDLRTKAALITAWSQVYTNRYTAEMQRCVPNTYALYQQDIEAIKSVLLIYYATMTSDYVLLQDQMVSYTRITMARSTLIRAVNADIQTLRAANLSVSWPRP